MLSKDYIFDLLCKIGFVLLVNLVGLACMLGAYTMTNAIFSNMPMLYFAIVWYAVGAAAAIYWPLRFRKELEKEELTEILQVSLPMAPALGPISIIACRPI